MTHTNPEFLYELKIGIAALQRACYEVIEACVKIDYAIRLLDKSEIQPISINNNVERTAAAESIPMFTPAKKPPTTKGDPLAELAAQMSPQDREKLIAAMESKEKK